MKTWVKAIFNENFAQGAIEYILLASGILLASVITISVYYNIVTDTGKVVEGSGFYAANTINQAMAQALQDFGGSGETAEQETVVEIPGNEIDEDGDGIILCNPRGWWRTHGRFVSCVARHTNELVASGHLSGEEGERIVSEAAHSNVGRHWIWGWLWRLWYWIS